MIDLTPDEIRAVLDVVGPLVSVEERAHDRISLLGRAEFKLDVALLEYEQKLDREAVEQ